MGQLGEPKMAGSTSSMLEVDLELDLGGLWLWPCLAFSPMSQSS
jgi:hypothetical protein